MVQTFVLALFSIFLGALLCFGGYRFLMVMLPVWTFFGGLWLGAKGTHVLLGEGFLATATGLTIGLALGVVLAIFSWQFYQVGVAVIGGIVGAWFSSGILDLIGLGTGFLPALIALVCAVVVALLTYLRGWQRYLIIGLSAIAGANSLVLALLLGLGRVSPKGLLGAGSAIRPILSDSWLWSLLWLAIAIAGILVQLRSYRRYEFVREEFVKYWS
jgi:hypothetical protein